MKTDVADGSVRRTAGRAIRWSLLGTMLLKFGNFAMSLIMARLLQPSDFGVYAIAWSAVAFLMMVNDLGMIAAAVQWRGDFNRMAPTATLFAFTSAVLLYCGFWLAAPLFAEFAGSAEATPVVRIATTVILIDGVTAIRGALLLRTFQQTRLVAASVIGLVCQIVVAVTLAAGDAGPASLAIGQVAGAIAMAAVIMWSAKLPVRIGFDREVARRLVRFGTPLALSMGVEAILLNVDYVIVGRELGTDALGFYMLAFTISSWIPGVVLNVMRWVSVPSFSRLSEDDGELSEGVRWSIVLLVRLMVPVTVVLAVLGPAIVSFLYGDKWMPAADALRFLAVLSVVRLVTALVTDIVTSVGKTHLALWMNLGWAATLVPALVIGTRSDGIRGTAIAHVLIGLGVAAPLALIALWRVDVSLSSVPRAVVRAMLGGVVAGIVCLLVTKVVDIPAFLQLLSAGTATLFAYIVIMVPVRNLRSWIARPGELVGLLRGAER